MRGWLPQAWWQTAERAGPVFQAVLEELAMRPQPALSAPKPAGVAVTPAAVHRGAGPADAMASGAGELLLLMLLRAQALAGAQPDLF